MTSDAFPRLSRHVRSTIQSLLPATVMEKPEHADGEARWIIQNAQRLHESLSRLPPAQENRKCIVIGSRGIEAPYLAEDLGWRDVTCVCPPTRKSGFAQSHRRIHHATGRVVDFKSVEHDIEHGPWPFDSEQFGLAVFWGGLEHLRQDPEFALYELNRICAPGASVSVLTANPISLKATHSVIRGHPLPLRLHSPSAQGPCRLYAPHELVELLEGTGWHVDALTSIVPDAPASWSWWKKWLMRKMVADQRSGFGLAQPYWNAHLLAHATRVSGPTRSFPSWLYKDEKIRQLKIEMMELISRQPTAMAS